MLKTTKNLVELYRKEANEILKKREEKFKAMKHRVKNTRQAVGQRVKRKFRLWYRLSQADKDGNVKCYTCGTVHSYKEVDAGHFLHSRLNFDERNHKIQCLTKESKLKMLNGEYKNIDNINVGDKLIAFDENTFKKKISTVKNIHSFIPDELYEVALENGDKFYSTGNHLVVVNSKWIKVKNILHNGIVNDIMEL